MLASEKVGVGREDGEMTDFEFGDLYDSPLELDRAMKELLVEKPIEAPPGAFRGLRSSSLQIVPALVGGGES